MARPNVAVIGGGAWGLALACAAARTGGTTLLLSRRARPDGPASGVTLARGGQEVADRARLLLPAAPAGGARRGGGGGRGVARRVRRRPSLRRARGARPGRRRDGGRLRCGASRDPRA